MNNLKEAETDKSLSNNNKTDIKGWILSIALAVVIALFLKFFVFDIVKVDGESMLPTLHNREYVFMQRVSYYFKDPERGDIVVCRYPERQEKFIKRVVGVKGDKIRITDGILYINDEPNYEHYNINEGIDHDLKEVTLGENEVFVMGDNRNHSHDSSRRAVGPLTEDMVLGKAEFVLWPLGMMHGLE